jgi:hypothetical protein
MNKKTVVDYEKHILYQWSDEGTGCFTEQNELYKEKFNKLVKCDFETVLEVGPGSGTFAKYLLDNYPIKKYYILDLEKNLVYSRSKLINYSNIEYFASQNYEQTFDLDIDLFVSIVCLLETPQYYRENLINNIFPKCKGAFYIGNPDNWITNSFCNNFNYINPDTINYIRCIVLYGHKGDKKEKEV